MHEQKCKQHPAMQPSVLNSPHGVSLKWYVQYVAQIKTNISHEDINLNCSCKFVYVHIVIKHSNYVIASTPIMQIPFRGPKDITVFKGQTAIFTGMIKVYNDIDTNCDINRRGRPRPFSGLGNSSASLKQTY